MPKAKKRKKGAKKKVKQEATPPPASTSATSKTEYGSASSPCFMLLSVVVLGLIVFKYL